MSSLATVNFFLACVGVTQVTRILIWRQSQQGSTVEAAKVMAEDSVSGAKGIKESTKGVVEAVEEKVKPSS